MEICGISLRSCPMISRICSRLVARRIDFRTGSLICWIGISRYGQILGSLFITSINSSSISSGYKYKSRIQKSPFDGDHLPKKRCQGAFLFAIFSKIAEILCDQNDFENPLAQKAMKILLKPVLRVLLWRGPFKAGMMQNEHRLLHPSAIFK